LPFDARPIAKVTGAETMTGPTLLDQGDVRYFRFFVDTKDPLLIHFQTDDDLANYKFYVHQDQPDGGVVDRLRAAEADADGASRKALFEVLYPDPNKYYFIEVANAARGNRGFQMPPFEARPITPISSGQTVTGPTLNGAGDVRYYSFNVSSSDTVSIQFRGADDLANYNFYVHQDQPDGGVVNQLKATLGTDATFQVANPDPKKTYYIEVTNQKPGSRDFSFALNGTLSPPATEVTGDLNGDRQVNVTDVILALRFVVGLQTPDARQTQLADLNADGAITITDALAILRKSVGLP
jgi:hypothetical protein